MGDHFVNLSYRRAEYTQKLDTSFPLNCVIKIELFRGYFADVYWNTHPECGIFTIFPDLRQCDVFLISFCEDERNLTHFIICGMKKIYISIFLDQTIQNSIETISRSTIYGVDMKAYSEYFKDHGISLHNFQLCENTPIFSEKISKSWQNIENSKHYKDFLRAHSVIDPTYRDTIGIILKIAVASHCNSHNAISKPFLFPKFRSPVLHSKKPLKNHSEEEIKQNISPGTSS
ncbi:hypothetical protein TRFO_36377 [Tritrichomonas foetus]|uniref:Uncharacterized protein n=1 Tax=Tritrichomonas foetus TaxID=1144522 RepID=A0A1J4JE40_9EUKA|nr:hypothetical protein TRFO_36377 [Tritrichomonas foetus]|eukprot:OHS97376.1 hypothetical protein TRFO_36377 [Tritrichomonas foetus]